MLRIEKVGIDESVAIPCPKKMFKPAIAADACPLCEFFDGVGVLSNATHLPWYKRYCIRCTHPIERRTQPIKFALKK